MAQPERAATGAEPRIVRLEGEINRAGGKIHGEGQDAGNKEQEQSQTIKSGYSPVDLVAVRPAAASGWSSVPQPVRQQAVLAANPYAKTCEKNCQRCMAWLVITEAVHDKPGYVAGPVSSVGYSTKKK